MRCEILIVGSGPAGACAALGLAEASASLAERTVLVEAATHPRPKACGGVISPRALDTVVRLAGPLPVVPGLPVRQVLVRHGDRSQHHRLPRPALAVHRPTFDASLVAAVRRTGVAVREATRLVGLQREPDGWRARLRGPDGPYELRPRLVLGADGALGPVRRLAGLPRGLYRARLAHAERAQAPADPPADTLLFELPAGADANADVPGYFWSFPAPRPRADTQRSHGVFALGRRQPARRLATHLARRLPPGPSPRGAVQRLYQPGLPCAAPGVGLLGEALGADPLSGEGIAQAILTGGRAGALLPELFAQGDLRLRGWTRAVLGDEARVLGQNALLALAAYGPTQGWVTRRVMASPALADLCLRRFCGLRHSPAERWDLLARVVSAGGLW